MPTMTGSLRLLTTACHGDGEPVPGAADRDGVALRRATCPELTRAGARARLVVLGMVGGRGSLARTFVQMVAKARVRSDPPCYSAAWSKHGCCDGAPSCRASLLEYRGGHGADGVSPPSFEVERDQRTAGLCG